MSKGEATQDDTSATYLDAGVDIDAGQRLAKSFGAIAEPTKRPEMLSGIGGFAALCELPAGYQQPVLVASTDGVGTKLKLAIELGQHESLGQDLVAMSVNDVIVTGGEPLLFLDYFATSKLDPEVASPVVRGIGAACEIAGCTLAGGETAEMPGLYQSGDYDLAGFCIGVVEKSKIIDCHSIQAGDLLIGMPSSGPHSNGFSLIRMILERQGIRLSAHKELARQLMTPTHIYVRAVRALTAAITVPGLTHITGGGLTENLPRLLTGQTELGIRIDLQSWERPSIFKWLQQQGNLSEQTMLRTFNCGIGMVACVREEDKDQALMILKEEAMGARDAAPLLPVVLGQIETTKQPPAKQRVQFHGRF